MFIDRARKRATTSPVLAELLLIAKRNSTWILLGVAVLLSVSFTYALPYAAYRGNDSLRQFSGNLPPLLPGQLVSSVLAGFPFYFGIIALILGALSFGSEYSWGTLKTSLTQQPDRLQFVLSKGVVLGIVLVPYTAANFLASATASLVIASRENAAVQWPAAWEFVLAFGEGWLILTLWAAFGAMLAILSRGTALALGVGIIYGIIVEPFLTGFAAGIEALQKLSAVLLRANGYSLVAPLRTSDAVEAGPGVFEGPFVDPWQALAVVLLYVAGFTSVTVLVLKRRDID